MSNFTYSTELYHHGIRGQKWGQRNGPPYPLSGGDYTETEWKALKKERSKKYSRYNKEHYDQVIREGEYLQTLARDPKRTTGVDMFYASYTKHDNDRYNALFNHKTEQIIYDKDGNPIGTGKVYKWAIKNEARKDLKIASRDSGAKVLMELYKKDRDFSNFVHDPDRLNKYFHKMYVPHPETYKKILRKMSKPDFIPTDKDLVRIYDVFNCVIPSNDKDVVMQRTKMFKLLKEKGYSGILDINDALNNPAAANAPTIVFDMEAIMLKNVRQTTTKDVMKSKALTLGRYALGYY